MGLFRRIQSNFCRSTFGMSRQPSTGYQNNFFSRQVVAVQVKTIQDAIRDKKPRFNFMGTDISLNPVVGLFITMVCFIIESEVCFYVQWFLFDIRRILAMLVEQNYLKI